MTEHALVLRNYLEQDASLKRLQAVAASMVNPRHLVAVALSAISQNKALMACSQESLFLALAKCAITGLEPDGQMAAIVPYKGKATFVPMYMGLIDLCHRSGKVVDITANAVFDGDEFAYQYGDKGFLHHVPTGDEIPDQLTHVYTLVTYLNGIVKFKVMTRKQCDGVRKRSPYGSNSKSPWATDYVAMCCKTVIRRHWKTLPKSNEMRFATAFEQNDELQRPQKFDLGVGGVVVEDEPEPAKAETMADKIPGTDEQPPQTPQSDSGDMFDGDKTP
jgi:recombination protein RecT